MMTSVASNFNVVDDHCVSWQKTVFRKIICLPLLWTWNYNLHLHSDRNVNLEKRVTHFLCFSWFQGSDFFSLSIQFLEKLHGTHGSFAIALTVCHLLHSKIWSVNSSYPNIHVIKECYMFWQGSVLYLIQLSSTECVHILKQHLS